MSNTSTTNICGYYNANRWPIQLSVARFNVTLTLKPGEYLLDRQGRKINDPYFEVYANNKQLARETSDTPVPLILVPVVTAQTGPVPQTNPVRAVTEWTRDARGIRQPVLTPKATPKPAPNAMPTPTIPMVTGGSESSVRPMSMADAIKQGLVRKSRIVPEDYGVTDTTGLPPSRIPSMKYSIDSSVGKPVAPLPPEALQLPKGDPANPTRSQLVTGLTQSSKTAAPETLPENTLFSNAVVQESAGSPLTTGIPATVETVESVESGESITDGMEPPQLGQVDDNPPQASPPPEEPLVAEPVDDDVAPIRPVSQKFICGGCVRSFPFRGALVNHALKEHPAQAKAIISMYPE